ncbi:MAG: hypothetical protein K0B84_10230 [Firmicutes bacterium]|nr:hypothetical protein [Bacillota bacterium]
MHDMEIENSKNFAKPPYNSVESKFQTPLGYLDIRGPVDPDQLQNYRLAEGLNCFRPSCRQHKSLVSLAGQTDGMVFTASLASTVISYVSFQKPDYPWWLERCLPEIIELGGLETDLSWRKMGLTKILLDRIFKNPEFTYFEDYIVIAVQFIQSWDLRNTGLSSWAYREFMLKLFSKYGFLTWETVDPEIREHPCNVLLARVGANIDNKRITQFTGTCMGT